MRKLDDILKLKQITLIINIIIWFFHILFYINFLIFVNKIEMNLSRKMLIRNIKF
jgi:hypothetical protein